MSLRTVNELYKIALMNFKAWQVKDKGWGLCSLLWYLHKSELITEEEYEEAYNHLMIHKPTPEYNSEFYDVKHHETWQGWPAWWWNVNDKSIRKAYLKQMIKQTKNK